MSDKVEEMFAFVCADDDGNEGLTAFYGPGGMAYPMVGADMERVDSLMGYGQQVADNTRRPVRVIRFGNAEVIRVIEPRMSNLS
jgi:hypothetical protein